MNRLFKHISNEVGSVRDALNEFKVEVYYRFDMIEKRLDNHDAQFAENKLIQNEILNAIGADNEIRDRRITKLERCLA